MRKIKRIIAAGAMAAMMVLPTYGAFASSVTFTNFSVTATPGVEDWEVASSKQKADNEQNWYITLTQKRGLASDEARALAISNDSNPAMQGINPYPLKSTTTSSGAIKYHKTVVKGKSYTLYISGNENVNATHEIVLSGRYSS